MKRAMLAALIVSAAALIASGTAGAQERFLYVLSNNVENGQNSVIAYQRMADGTLTPHPSGPFLTGGTGINNSTNGKLGPNDNDTPLIVSPGKRRLFAVNGHSNTIAVFDIQRDGSLRPVPGSPFPSMGVGPVSLAISGDILLVANRNEDPHQLVALGGGAYGSYVSFQMNDDGSLTCLSIVDLHDGQKPTQVLVSSRNDRIVFGNDFQVDVDFDGDGGVSSLFGPEPQVRGRLQAFALAGDGTLRQVNHLEIPETVDPAPEVPTIPLGIWDHPTRDLVYVGLVTRNQLGVFRYADDGSLSFVAAVPNSGQDICWIRVSADGTRLYAVNNLPRDDAQDMAGTVTVFDISGDRAERPVEIGRIELPMPFGTFVNNRNIPQPNSTPFQLTLDPTGRFLYVVNQRIDQTPGNQSRDGNVLHVLEVDRSGDLRVVQSRNLGQDGVRYTARPQGVVALDW